MAQILIRTPDSLKEYLRTSAQQMGLTLNALVLQISLDWANLNHMD